MLGFVFSGEDESSFDVLKRSELHVLLFGSGDVVDNEAYDLFSFDVGGDVVQHVGAFSAAYDCSVVHREMLTQGAFSGVAVSIEEPVDRSVVGGGGDKLEHIILPLIWDFSLEGLGRLVRIRVVEVSPSAMR